MSDEQTTDLRESIVRVLRRYRNARNGDIGPGGAGCQRWVSVRYALDGDVNGARGRRGGIDHDKRRRLELALYVAGLLLAVVCAIGTTIVFGVVAGVLAVGTAVGVLVAVEAYGGADDA